MHHNPLRQLGIRIGILIVIFGICTLGAYLISLPHSWAWGAMLTMLTWTTFLKKVM